MESCKSARNADASLGDEGLDGSGKEDAIHSTKMAPWWGESIRVSSQYSIHAEPGAAADRGRMSDFWDS